MNKQLTEKTSFYRQVKNPNPEFIPENGKKTLPFCEKIREKAAGFTQRMEFQSLVAMSIARGERKRRPPQLRIRALEASLQALCHYFNPLTPEAQARLEKVNCTNINHNSPLLVIQKRDLAHIIHLRAGSQSVILSYPH